MMDYFAEVSRIVSMMLLGVDESEAYLQLEAVARQYGIPQHEAMELVAVMVVVESAREVC